MTLRQLEYLLAVAQTGSFTEAASRLHVSQPTLSQQIRALEAEVGGPLLDRSPGSVGLTPAGKALVGDARAAVTSAQRALDAGRRALRSAPELLTMATVRSLAAAVLPATIKRWHEVQPDVSIRLLEFASRAARHRGGRGRARRPRHRAAAGRVERRADRARLGAAGARHAARRPARAGAARTSRSSRSPGASGCSTRRGTGSASRRCRPAAPPASSPSGRCAPRRWRSRRGWPRPASARRSCRSRTSRPSSHQHVRGVDPPVSWRVWAYVTGPEFPDIAGAFVDVLVEGPWQTPRLRRSQ